MTLTNCRATLGLNALATPTNGGTSGSIQVGLSNASISLSDATKIHSFEAAIVGFGSALTTDISDLDGTGSTAWTAGVQQVETNTVVAASGITGSGNATVTVTATGMTGTPKAISVALTTAAHTTATLIAAALATGLNADTDFSALFVASSSGADLIVKAKLVATYTINGTTVNAWPADIANLNVAIANGTCTGITTAATSASTTAGVLTVGTYALDLTGNDVFGDATSGLTEIHAIYIKNDSTSAGPLYVEQSTFISNYLIFPGAIFLVADSGGNIDVSDIAITADTTCKVTVTLAGL